ncbi:hypothetical protein CEE44_05225 [Candidatus Woesearchaeota archaeon B3_Woes]|nr:MAG: hypothetical protein CEE44_05225 [Candidatus Woesearchaeota archaeon B3_Woes]
MPSQRQLRRTLEEDINGISNLSINISRNQHKHQTQFLKEIVNILMDANPELDIDKIKKSVHFSNLHHFRKYRDSGHPAVSHDYHVGYILAYWGLGDDAVITGLSHDLIEDSEEKNIPYHQNKKRRLNIIDQINRNFGSSVLLGVLALSKPPDSRLMDITQKIDEIIEQTYDIKAIREELNSLNQTYSKIESKEIDRILYQQLEEFKTMYPNIDFFNHARVADNIANLLTKQYMRPNNGMTAEQRQQRFCETSEQYVLPLAREIDQEGTIEMRIAPYIRELITK